MGHGDEGRGALGPVLVSLGSPIMVSSNSESLRFFDKNPLVTAQEGTKDVPPQCGLVWSINLRIKISQLPSARPGQTMWLVPFPQGG